LFFITFIHWTLINQLINWVAMDGWQKSDDGDDDDDDDDDHGSIPFSQVYPVCSRGQLQVYKLGPMF